MWYGVWWCGTGSSLFAPNLWSIRVFVGCCVMVFDCSSVCLRRQLGSGWINIFSPTCLFVLRKESRAGYIYLHPYSCEASSCLIFVIFHRLPRHGRIQNGRYYLYECTGLPIHSPGRRPGPCHIRTPKLQRTNKSVAHGPLKGLGEPWAMTTTNDAVNRSISASSAPRPMAL